MNCYLCEKEPGHGPTHYHVNPAIGVCQNCGVGVCLKHGYKEEVPGAPLLCRECAGMQDETAEQKPQSIALPQTN